MGFPIQDENAVGRGEKNPGATYRPILLFRRISVGRVNADLVQLDDI